MTFTTMGSAWGIIGASSLRGWPVSSARAPLPVKDLRAGATRRAPVTSR